MFAVLPENAVTSFFNFTLFRQTRLFECDDTWLNSPNRVSEELALANRRSMDALARFQGLSFRRKRLELRLEQPDIDTEDRIDIRLQHYAICTEIIKLLKYVPVLETSPGNERPTFPNTGDQEECLMWLVTMRCQARFEDLA